MKEQTRIKTMGFPKKVEVKGLATTAKAKQQPAADTANPAAAGSNDVVAHSSTQGVNDTHGAEGLQNLQHSAACATAERAATKHVRAGEMIETLKSKVPLKWACSELYPATSSYITAFGGNPGKTPQVGFGGAIRLTWGGT